MREGGWESGWERVWYGGWWEGGWVECYVIIMLPNSIVLWPLRGYYIIKPCFTIMERWVKVEKWYVGEKVNGESWWEGGLWGEGEGGWGGGEYVTRMLTTPFFLVTSDYYIIHILQLWEDEWRGGMRCRWECELWGEIWGEWEGGWVGDGYVIIMLPNAPKWQLHRYYIIN